jgi:sterol desaturase/sphingolipid hydroxylase (fatty acid hydroxylase superfamily)
MVGSGTVMAARYFIEFVTGSTVLLWLTIFFIGLLVERARPAERRQPSRNIVLNIGYAIVHSWVIFALAPTAIAASVVGVDALGGGVIALPERGWGLLWAIPLYLLAMDFSDYLFHRAQHAWPILWAMHSLHHSDTSVNVTTTPRHFWLEVAIRVLFIYPFVNVLLRPSATIFTAYVLMGYWNFVVHMNIRLSFGRFWAVLSSPQYHRIHHAAAVRYANRNFAALFPMIDVIFGTHYRAEKNEYLSSGLETGEAPAGLFEAVTWPVRRYLRVRRVPNAS